MARRRLLNRSKSEASSAGAASAGTRAESQAKLRRGAQKQSAWYNRLSLILLLLTPVVLACYLLIFMIPTLPLNPFPPYAHAMATFAPTLTPQPT